MQKRGQLFIFEGADGVGKSTLVQSLSEHFDSINTPTKQLAFPGKLQGTLGLHVYQLHHQPDTFGIETIHPASLQILHLAAHIDAIEEQIRPAIEAGMTVILDRFWWSMWVYGKIDGVDQQILRLMCQIEQRYWANLQPDAAFLVNRSTPLRPDESGVRWSQLAAAYYELAKAQEEYCPVCIVDNEKSLADSLQQIIDFIAHIDQEPKEEVEKPAHESEDLSSTITPEELTVSTRAGAWRNQNALSVPHFFRSLSPAKPTAVYDTYWRFAAERQEIFFRRVAGEAPPWTDDPTLRRYKFTNAYRASDRTSQYLIRDVIYKGDSAPDELFFRIMLFKIFNRIETWQHLQQELGTIAYADYSFDRYDQILTRRMAVKTPIFSNAYIMPSGGKNAAYRKKHRNYLKVLEQMMEEEVPTRLQDFESMQEAFELLRSYHLIGDFLAYQYITDLNYSPFLDFNEMEFVMPGPGAKDGIHKCFSSLGGLNEVDIIKLMAERQAEEFERLGLEWKSLWGRPLQLIDCQNLFCEADKYARITHPHTKGLSKRKRIKQKYQLTPKSIDYWYPPKWGINENIQQEKEVDHEPPLESPNS